MQTSEITGNFAADKIPNLVDETFMIVNASEAVMAGSHCMQSCIKQQEIYFADPLSLPLQSYAVLYKVISVLRVSIMKSFNCSNCSQFKIQT